MVEEFFDKSPKILGILPTMFDSRTTVAQQALQAVRTKFGSKCKVFSPVNMDTAVKKAQIQQQLIYDFVGSKAAQSYKKITRELVEMM